MANFKFLILAASAAFFSSASHAGYAQISPPAGFGGSPGAWTYQAANASQWLSSTVRTNAALNVGGRAVTVPVAMRFAANAGVFAARFAFSNPLVIGAAAVAALALHNIQWDGSKWISKQDSVDTIYRYLVDGEYQWYDSKIAACNAKAAKYSQTVVSKTINSDGRCEIVWSYLQYGYPQYSTDRWIIYQTSSTVNSTKIDPITDVETFIAKSSPAITPDKLPDFMPGQPIPVADPIINPSSDPLPLPQPYIIPMGDPAPVPNTNPQQYKTPVIQIVPSPTADEPWRVDIQPKDIIRTDTNPVTNPTSPSTQTEQEKTPGLCDMYPDILACQKPNLDTPTMQPLETKDVSINLVPDSGWGADNASCPSPRHLNGARVDYDFQTVCNFMTGIRPVIIAVAWLSAAMILIGFKRGE